MTQSLSIATTPASSRHGTIGLAFSSALRAGQCAQRVVESFIEYDAAFSAVTKRAPERFQLRDWQGSQLDAVERAESYRQWVAATVADLHRMSGELFHKRGFWQQVQRHFVNLVDGLPDSELSKAFFNAAIRGVFKKAELEFPTAFSIDDIELLNADSGHVELCRFACHESTHAAAVSLLKAVSMDADWSDVNDSAQQLAGYIEAKLTRRRPTTAFESLQLLNVVFYQFTRAYVVGSIDGRGWQLPFALTLNNTEAGVAIEAVRLGRAELSQAFGFMRSCFHVELEHTAETVVYLNELLPAVSVGEWFAILGRSIDGRAAVG